MTSNKELPIIWKRLLLGLGHGTSAKDNEIIMVSLTFPLAGLLREAKMDAGNACGLSML